MATYDSWNRGADRARPTTAVTPPTACPACQSATISTTARNPDENSYWRCGGCGEIWNASRRTTTRSGGYRWP
jgi:transposase-like protein